MKVICFHLADPIEWRVRKSDSRLLPLKAFPGWSILSPLGMLDYFDEPFWRGPGMPISVDEYSVTIFQVVLCYSGPNGADEVLENRAEQEILPTLLLRLRYVSGQVSLSANIMARSGITTWETKGEKDTWFPTAIRNSGLMRIREDFFRSAITQDILERTIQLPLDFVVPVHAEVLLDALLAQRESDHRRCILYSAIAVESLAGDYLEKAYERVLTTQGLEHRVTKFKVTDNNETLKDPIYDVLSQGENFGKMLHQQPLYLLGRSMLIENDALYQRALKLYSTRNKIAHRGVVPAEQAYLELSADGARTAISTAIEVARWFGDEANYYSNEKFISIENGKEN